MSKNIINQDYNKFLADLKERVASSRYKAALSVDYELILLAFSNMKRFSHQNVKYMLKFAEDYKADEIGQQPVDQMPWVEENRHR